MSKLLDRDTGWGSELGHCGILGRSVLCVSVQSLSQERIPA